MARSLLQSPFCPKGPAWRSALALLLLLSWEDPLEKEMATHSSILAWRIPMDRGAWRATVHGVIKTWTRLSDFHTKFRLNSRCYQATSGMAPWVVKRRNKKAPPKKTSRQTSCFSDHSVRCSACRVILPGPHLFVGLSVSSQLSPCPATSPTHFLSSPGAFVSFYSSLPFMLLYTCNKKMPPTPQHKEPAHSAD